MMDLTFIDHPGGDLLNRNDVAIETLGQVGSEYVLRSDFCTTGGGYIELLVKIKALSSLGATSFFSYNV
jgi:hypothetical protein